MACTKCLTPIKFLAHKTAWVYTPAGGTVKVPAGLDTLVEVSSTAEVPSPSYILKQSDKSAAVVVVGAVGAAVQIYNP